MFHGSSNACRQPLAIRCDRQLSGGHSGHATLRSCPKGSSARGDLPLAVGFVVADLRPLIPEPLIAAGGQKGTQS
jgi:hypothetical protein